MSLAIARAVQPLDDSANPLEGPQLGAKAMLGRALQYGRSHGRQLPLIELGRSAILQRKHGIERPIVPAQHAVAQQAIAQLNRYRRLARLRGRIAVEP